MTTASDRARRRRPIPAGRIPVPAPAAVSGRTAPRSLAALALLALALALVLPAQARTPAVPGLQLAEAGTLAAPAGACSFGAVSRRARVVAAVFTEPPEGDQPTVLRIGYPDREAVVLVSTMFPRAFVVEAGQRTTVTGVFVNGPEGTAVTTAPARAALVSHIAGAPNPACVALALPNAPGGTAQDANLALQRISLTITGRAPDIIIDDNRQSIEIGDVAGIGRDGLTSSPLYRALNEEAVRSELDSFMTLMTGLPGEVPPPVEGCTLPLDTSKVAAVLVAVGRGERAPLTVDSGTAAGRGGVLTASAGPAGPSSLQTGRVNLQVAPEADGRPVVLVLNAYHTTEWVVGLMPQATVAAVVLSGFGQQTLVGLPAGIPVLNHTGHSLNQACWAAGVEPRVILDATRDDPTLGGLVPTLVGRAADRAVLAETAGLLTTNPDIQPLRPQDLIYAADRGRVYDRDVVPDGMAGLLYLFQKGILRMASSEDVAKWYALAYPQETAEAGKYVVPRHRLAAGSALMITTGTHLPAGIDAGTATYLLGVGVPMPRSGLDQTELYVAATGRCLKGGTDTACEALTD